MADELHLIEPIAVPDTFVSGLAEVENLGGGNFRFVFYTKQHDAWVISAKLIGSREEVVPVIIMAAKAIGCEMVGRVCPDLRLAH